jgi:hypothetical protein
MKSENKKARRAVVRALAWAGLLGLAASAVYAWVLMKRMELIVDASDAITTSTEAYWSTSIRAMSPTARQIVKRHLNDASTSGRGVVDVYLAGLKPGSVEQNGIQVRNAEVQMVTMVKYGASAPSLYVEWSGTTASALCWPDARLGQARLRMWAVPFASWRGAYALNDSLHEVLDSHAGFASDLDQVVVLEPIESEKIGAYFAVFVPTPEYQIHVFEFGTWKGSVAIYARQAPEKPHLRLFTPIGILKR